MPSQFLPSRFQCSVHPDTRFISRVSYFLLTFNYLQVGCLHLCACILMNKTQYQIKMLLLRALHFGVFYMKYVSKDFYFHISHVLDVFNMNRDGNQNYSRGAFQFLHLQLKNYMVIRSSILQLQCYFKMLFNFKCFLNSHQITSELHSVKATQQECPIRRRQDGDAMQDRCIVGNPFNHQDCL